MQPLKYLKYFITASNGKGHGIHSPFVYDFVTNVLNDRLKYREYARIESVRNSLLMDRTIIKVEDLGAGSAIHKSDQRTIASIARNSAKPAKFGQLFFRMVKKYKPANMLELGTSLGISAAYLALGNPGGRLITMEGSDSLASKARENLQKLDIKNTDIIEGNFDEKLHEVIQRMTSVDLAFIDGNHRMKPTIRYFEQLLTKTNNDSILIFDDIHWSGPMEDAWLQIRQHPAVRCTIDLFFIGIVLFRHEFKQKQEFIIRF